MREIIKTGIVLMIYTLVAGALLALVYIKTAPVIEANKAAASGDPVRAEVLAGMDGGFEPRGEKTDFLYWIGYNDAGKKIPGGYIFIASGKGYSSTIETMVGVDIEGVITGAKVLFQQETPGLGDKIEQILPGESVPWFTRQFLGLSASDNIKVVKDDGEIDSISGATISSRAVSLSISNGLKQLMAVLNEETFVPEEMPPEEEAEQEPASLPTDDVIAEVLPDMTGGYELKNEDSDFPYWTGYRDLEKSTPGGYAFITRGEGFDSIIVTLVGVDTDGKITGIKVLYHNETEDYGDLIEEIHEGEKDPWFTRQLIGKSLSDNIALSEDNGVIDAISGATVSSLAVTESVKEGLEGLKAVLSGEPFSPKIKSAKSSSVESEVEEETEDESAEVPSDEDLAEVLPDMTGGYELKNEASDFPYWTGYRDAGKSKPYGYAFVARGEGFSSTIETLVGIDIGGTIIGIKVLFHEETEDYGDLIEEIREGEKDPWFTRQLIGKSLSDSITLAEEGGVIDAISGATVSSKAVTESVGEGLKKLIEIVGK
ncbi:MAG: FMN-binding protein [Candidatus Latescibacteria bacterium]|nr:FMN-binding protein [Candidatus Latescibacterota bacterium]